MKARPDSDTSAELLTRAQAGDTAALNALLEIYLPRLRRWASGRLPAGARGLQDTEDVVQDTVIAAIRHLNHVEVTGEGALQAYLRRAVANRLTDMYRRAQVRPPHAEADSSLPGALPSPLDQAIGSEAVTRYEAALARLSDRDRQAIVMRIELCCPFDEIAAALGKPGASHARVTVSRALARLAREMRHARR